MDLVDRWDYHNPKGVYTVEDAINRSIDMDAQTESGELESIMARVRAQQEVIASVVGELNRKGVLSDEYVLTKLLNGYQKAP